MTGDPLFNTSTKAGTAGGFLTILLVNLASSDIFKTMILSLIGAVVSFVVSLGLRVLLKWLKR